MAGFTWSVFEWELGVRVGEKIFLPLFLSGLYPPPPSMSSRSLSEKPRKKKTFQ